MANELTLCEIFEILGEVEPDDMDEETLFLIREYIAIILSKFEQEGVLEAALMNLRPEDEPKARAMANGWIQWRNNRTIN